MKSYLLETDEKNSAIKIDDIHIYDEQYKAGNPYNTSINVMVRSGCFSGAGTFELDIANFCTFSRELYDLYNNLSGTVKLNDICYGAFLQFEPLDRLGHIQISGQVFGDGTVHSVEFEFRIDQTELRSFSSGLYADFGLLKGYETRAIYNQ